MKNPVLPLSERLSIIYEYWLTHKITTTNLAKIFNTNRATISNYIKSKGHTINPNNKFPINSNIFTKIDTPEKAYWLGFMYADGTVASNKNGVSLELQLSDKEHVEKFRKFIQWEGVVRTDHFRARLCVQDKTIREDLIRLGCVPRKSLILKFPINEQVSDKYVYHFIRGYVDGDGSIHISKPVGTNGTRNIIVQVLGTKEFLSTLLYKMQVTRTIRQENIKKYPDSNCYSFEISGIKACKFLSKLFKDADDNFLARKKEKVIEYINFNAMYSKKSRKTGRIKDSDEFKELEKIINERS